MLTPTPVCLISVRCWWPLIVRLRPQVPRDTRALLHPFQPPNHLLLILTLVLDGISHKYRLNLLHQDIGIPIRERRGTHQADKLQRRRRRRLPPRPLAFCQWYMPLRHISGIHVLT